MPLVLFLGIFTWGADVSYREHPGARRCVADLRRRQAMDVAVRASRRTARNQRTARPGDRPIKLMMTSQDVIHGFFVPAFRVKQDVLPGRYTTVWFDGRLSPATITYFARSICGTLHSQHDRLDRRHGAGRIRAMAARECHRAESMAARGERRYQAVRLRRLPRPQAVVQGPRCKAFSAQRSRCADGRTVPRGRGFHLRRRSANPVATRVAGYPPIMPSFQGQNRRSRRFSQSLRTSNRSARTQECGHERRGIRKSMRSVESR